MNEGWKCPECGKCYAPWVSECRNEMCGVVTGSGLTNVTYPAIPCPPSWPYEKTTGDPTPSPYQWPNTAMNGRAGENCGPVTEGSLSEAEPGAGQLAGPSN